MQVVADTHVHIYPFYNIEQALGSILRNLAGAAQGAVRVACLTERYDCNLYATLVEAPPQEVSARFDIESGAHCLKIKDRNGAGEFYLLPGQQIITSENIEILSLNCDRRVTEGLSAEDTVHSILSLGGIPVVAWAPGKWFRQRGEVVTALLDKFSPDQLALGDTTLRPVGWGTPGIVKKAQQRGFRVLYGSDPLPFKGEETRPGSYYTRMTSQPETSETENIDPAAFIQSVLTAELSIRPAGSRSSLVSVLQRLYYNHRAPKPPRGLKDQQTEDWQAKIKAHQEFEKFAGQTVLVTGATGFTGRVLTHKLTAAGAVVKIIARESSDPGDLSELDIEWIRGDVYDPEVCKKAAHGVNYIFHVAAAFRETKPNEEGYRKVHLYSTQLLAKEVAGRPEFKCFLHVSTVGVHGHIEEGPADETYRFAPGDSYQRTKLEAELWLADFAKETGIPYSIVRPAPIFGPGDMRLLKIFRMVNKGFFLMLGKGKGLYNMIHVDDLTNIIMLAAVMPAARSEALIAAADESMGMVDMAKLISNKIGNKVRIIRMPVWPFYIASDICCAICRPLGISPPIYRRRVDFYTKDRIFDNSKVKQTLNYQFNYDNDSGIEETANWYLENNLLN